MSKKIIIVAVVALSTGLGAGYGISRLSADRSQEKSQSETAQQTNEADETPTFSEIMADLRSKQGEEFDKAYLTHMMGRSQDLIEMSSLIEGRSERDETKRWGDYITKVQISDINQMKTWYGEWGFQAQDAQNAKDEH